MGQSSGRRWFLKSVTALGGAASLPAPASAAEPHAQHGVRAPSQTYMYLTQPEVAFVEAAVARLIPADELGAGAKEAGVACFIDRQLVGAWGTMAKMYRQGPWPEGTPQQGYQSPLTPQQVYRIGIGEVNARCAKQYGSSFSALTPAQQDEVLRGLDGGKIELEGVRSQFFFNMLLANTLEGFFADPIYGGNRDKVGWKLVGFPGVAAVYTAHVDRHGVPYNAVPVSIQDIVDNVARVDEHGHPKHVVLTRQLGSFRPGEGVGGAAVHWGGLTWRFLPWDFETRSRTLARYGKGQLAEDCTSQDWGVAYDELERHFDRFEYLYGISGKAGNLRGRIVPGGNPFEGPRSREYPNPPLKTSYAGALFKQAAEKMGYKPFPTPTGAVSRAYTNEYGATINACVYCGYCQFFGCEMGC